jgi:hypothetical protein
MEKCLNIIEKMVKIHNINSFLKVNKFQLHILNFYYTGGHSAIKLKLANHPFHLDLSRSQKSTNPKYAIQLKQIPKLT